MRQRQTVLIILRRFSIALAAASAFSPISPTIAGPGDPIGPEFIVNTVTTSSQDSAGVAMNASGNFVIKWYSSAPERSIRAQRFSAAGTFAGNEFSVIGMGTSFAIGSVAIDANGGFIVAWNSFDTCCNTGDNVYIQRYLADGTPSGSAFLATSDVSDSQRLPSVAMDAGGDFIVAWEGPAQSSYARLFTADGTPKGNDFLVSAGNSPVVAMDANGNSLVAWMGSDTSGTGIYARRYAVDGTPLGGILQINNTIEGEQADPQVGMNASGDFVVTWRSFSHAGGNDVYARLYTADGIPRSGEFPVASNMVGNQGGSHAAMDAAGNFVITWTSVIFGVEAPVGLFGQRYAADGTPDADRFQISDRFDQPGSLAMSADGDFVVTWSGYELDGDDYGVRARLYEGGLVCSSGVFDFVDATSAGAEDTHGATAEIHRRGSKSGVATIHYATSDGTANSSSGDYQPISDGVVTFLDGETSKIISLTNILDDSIDEPVETFHLDITSVNTGSCVGSVQPTTDIQIADNDEPDTTPNTFSFVDQTNVAPNKLIPSNVVRARGINVQVAVSIVGGEYYSQSSGGWTSAPGTMNPDDWVKVRHTSASTPSTATNTTLTIGGVSDTFTTTTVAATDDTPDAFSFVDQTGMALNKLTPSNVVRARGINVPVAVSVVGGEYYSQSSGGWTSAPGTMNPDEWVKVRHTSAATPSTATNTTLTIGGVSDTFTTTTAAP